MNKFKKIKTFIKFLIGEEIDFEPEQRFLNITCLLICFAYFITLPINFLLGMNLTMSIINLIVSAIVAFLYYLARFKRLFVLTTAVMIVAVIISLSIDWFLNGGFASGMSYYFYSLLVIILFLFERRLRVILSILLVLNVITLFLLEYHNPHWIVRYSSKQQMFLDHCSNFIVAGPFIILAVYFSKQLYKKEKQNTKILIENYRKSGEHLKEKMNEKLKILSIREREIFKLIIEGKTNKEIASILCIEERTVKNHITNIYRKTEIKSRSEIGRLGQI